MQVALIYDRINKIGGAEVVLQALNRLYPEADWYTSVWDPQRAPFSRQWRVTPSWLNRIPPLRNRHELMPYLMPFAFEGFDLSRYDLVISVSSAEAKGVITRPETLHVNYCLTPTRYLYSHKQAYLHNRFLTKIGGWLRAWDQTAAKRPDVMISISQQVKKRVKKYYNRDSAVVYPPVPVAKFSSTVESTPIPGLPDSYYLVVSRLVAYKNISLAVRAFNHNRKPLVIIGTGSEAKRLRQLASDNIHFLGQLDEADVIRAYQHCLAFVQCNDEDFGIAMVEALAAGKPVVALEAGGALEIVTPSTGILYNEATTSALEGAIDALESRAFSADLCRKQAAKFADTIWAAQFKQRIAQAWQAHTNYGS